MSQKYKHPPIVEAVIDFKLSEPLTKTLVNKAKKYFLKEYPFCEDTHLLGVYLNPASKSAEYKEEASGYKISSNDGADILLINTHAFTVSRLAPYPGWNIIRERAEKDWKEWKKIVNPKIRRVGVRYINRVDIPISSGGRIEYEDYLKIFPQLPDNEIPVLSQYAMQIVVPLENNMSLLLNSATVPSPLLNHVSYILDIDISKEITESISEKEVWDLIDDMRYHKNRIFESSVTDKAKELFS